MISLDANNLYGRAMSQMLLQGRFRWMPLRWIEDVEWSTFPTDREFGYILDVDLDYPDSLHDQHNDYPLAPDRLQILTEMLSDKQQQIKAAIR